MIDELIYNLYKKGIRFSLNGDKLKVLSNQELTQSDISVIKKNKESIVQFIQTRAVDLDVIPSVENSTSYELSSSQRRLWILSKFEDASNAYLIPQIVRLEGELNFKAFSKAFQQLIDRHESLRTVFVQDQEGSPRQIVKCSTDLDCNVKFFDFSELTLTQIQDIIENTISNEINIGFNLEKGPLIRCVLIKETSGLHIWMLLMHHIISDGISMGVIRSEWSEFYNAEMGKRPPNMEPLSIQYKDYSAWHNAYLKSPQIESHKAYWLERFNGEIPILHLYSDNARPEISTYKGKTIYRTLDQGSSDRLKQYTQNQGGTLFITLQTILTIFLHKYTGQEDIVIGSPIAGREHPDLDGQVGFYVNTLALRNEFKKENTVSELYQQIKQNTLSAFSHQVFPYDELVDLLKLKRDVSRNPLFDVMLAFQSSQFSESDLKFERLLISDYALSNDYQVAKFDLSFGFEEHNTGINYSLNYNCDIYTERQIQHFLDHLLFILETIHRCDQVSISNYDILLDSDKKYLLEGLNDTKSDFPKDNTIVDLFLSQVQMTSSEVAIKYENIEISYQQLNELSNELSHYLLYKYEIKPNDLIGIELEHSEWMIISLLAILKCGAAYVPIDPEYPDERKQFIKKDAKLELIISDQELIDFKKLHQKEQFPSTNPHVDIDPANLAYIIYTSGSTGVPKGCMVTHTSLVNYIDWIKVYNKGEQYNVVDIFSSLSFDFTVTSLFGGLTLGKTLRLHSSKEDLSNVLHTIVLDPKSAWIKLTPAHIKLIDESVLKSAGSKIFIIGGEALTTDQILHLQKNEDCVIYNEYGPTEATVGCIVKKIATAAEPFIGKPIQNTEVILLDESDRLVPFGSIGEICISGICLSKGYLNRAELTAEKFKNHPYKAHEQIYRTGDLGRWREDGDLEYHGRIDEQVKIRGYRIELGEIEHVLTGISNIGQVIVIARVLKEGTEKELIAYYTGKASAEDLRVYLQSKIPHYMIPGYYVQLDKIPLTHNGKVDRKKLPDPEGTGFAKAIYEAPKTEVERKLVEIWAQVLNIKSEELSVKSDFFQLGGDSIKAIQIVSKIRSIGYEIKMSNIMRSRHIIDSIQYLKPLTREIDQSLVNGSVLLSPVQTAFLTNQIVEGSDTDKDLYLQSFQLFFKTGITFQEVNLIINKLLEHHDSLRTRFHKNSNGNFEQYIPEKSDNSFFIGEKILTKKISENQALKGKFFYEEGKRVKSEIRLLGGPLIAIGLFHEYDVKSSHLLICIHHMVIDLVSWRILFEDIEAILTQLRNARVIELPEKTDSFQYWMNLNKQYLQSSLLSSHQMFWQDHLSQPFERINAISENGNRKFIQCQTIEFSLDRDESEIIHKAMNGVNKIETNAILLASLSMALNEVFGIERTMILIEGHGRDEYLNDVDINRTVGWFTSLYPFVLGSKQDEIESVIQIQDELTNLPKKGIGFGLIQYLSENPIDVSFHPQITFNYFGDFINDHNVVIEDNLFDFSDYSHSEDIHSNLLKLSEIDITGQTENKCIKMKLHFSPDRIDELLMTKLAMAYRTNLIKLGNQLGNYKQKRVLPGNLCYSNLNFDQVIQIEEKYGPFEDVFPLNAMQKAMLFSNDVHNSKNFYNEQFVHEFEGEFSLESWKTSFNILCSQIQALRLVYEIDIAPEPIQVCLKTSEYTPIYYDLSLHNKLDRDFKLKAIIDDDFNLVYDLGKAPPYRLIFVKISNQKYIRIWNNHHIIMDGWSTQLFFDMWDSIYQKNLPQLGIVKNPQLLKDYFTFLGEQDHTATKNYWKGYLKDYNNSICIPIDFNKKNVATQPAQFHFKIENQQTKELLRISELRRVTMNSIIQTLWGVLLAKYNNVNDVLFGSIVAGRPYSIPNIDSLVFNLINTVPSRVSFNDNDKLIDLILLAHEDYIKSDSYHFIPISEILETTARKMESIKSIFVYENYPSKASNSVNADNDFKSTLLSAKDALEYDLTLLCGIENGNLHFIFKVNENKFDSKLIHFIFESLSSLIDQFIKYNEVQVSRIELPRSNQLDLINNLSCGKSCNEGQFKSIVEIFEGIVNDNLDCIAVKGFNRNFTYDELNKESNLWASYFRDCKQLAKQSVIAILLERSDNTIPIILGILKAGMVYLNIDTNYPKNRIEYIIKNSHSDLIINDNVVQEFHTNKNKFIESNPLTQIFHDDLFYVIYTSGTTGNPKGCTLTHGNLYNLYLSMLNDTDIMLNQPRVLQYSSWSFDPSTQEMMNALLSGGQLILVSEEERNDWVMLSNKISDSKSEIVYMSPSVLRSLTDFSYFWNLEKSIKYIIPAGEALTITANIERLVWAENVVLYNFYGPAETHVVTFKKIGKEEINCIYPSIGTSIVNTKILILDKFLNLAPLGGIGEIYIFGASVGPGYLNNEIETAKKFIGHDTYGTLYKTGDSAIRDISGDIHFLGRNDNQVKINGVRIETEEIESALKTHPSVVNAAISIRKNSEENVYLVAFFEGDVSSEVLKSFLSSNLPSVFIPSVFSNLEKIPINKHGKIDRDALNNIEVIAFEDGPLVSNASSWLEQQLIDIWKTIVSPAQFQSKNTDFISQGGSSLKIIEFTSFLNHKFNLKLKFRDVLKAQNIVGLHEEIISRGVKNDSLLYLLTKTFNPSKDNFILFPAYFGEGLYYLDFATHICERYNVFTCDFYQEHSDQKIDTDSLVRKIILEFEKLGIDKVIVGGASYGFRVAYRFAYLKQSAVKCLVNFDGSVFENSQQELKTILEINNYELSKLSGSEKIKKEQDIDNLKSSGLNSRFENDSFLGQLIEIPLINFYPENSSVSLFQRSDITSKLYNDVVIYGNHDTMLTNSKNYSIILNQIINI